MTKSEFIDKIHETAAAAGLTKKAVGELVDAVFDGLVEVVKVKERFTYPGFGTFSVKRRGARVGRNPQTGEEIKIKPSKTVGFKPAPALKDRL